MVEVKVSSDPFTVWVEHDRLESTRPQGKHTEKEHTMPNATAKELRKQARELELDGWESMDRDELAAAIAKASGDEDEDEVDDEEVEEDDAEAEDSDDEDTEDEESDDDEEDEPVKPTKKASKKAVSTREEPEGDNPYRPKTNLWHMCELLMKGGTRSKMVDKLMKIIDIEPRSKAKRKLTDEEIRSEIDYRLVRTTQDLAKEHGFVIEKDGRGIESKVKAIPPSEQ